MKKMPLVQLLRFEDPKELAVQQATNSVGSMIVGVTTARLNAVDKIKAKH